MPRLVIDMVNYVAVDDNMFEKLTFTKNSGVDIGDNRELILVVLETGSKAW